jgi:pimeloyl-ACP methyl ester carboxylesterase
MSPSIIDVGGLRIAVYQNREHGPPIVCVHGNSHSGLTFSHQLSSPALNRYRIIALDLPGHGKSTRSSNPETDYTPASFVGVLVELCHRLGAEDAVLVGHSLGGHMAINALPYLPKVKGLVTFGTTPLTLPPKLDLAFLPSPALDLIFMPNLTSAEIDTITNEFVANGNEIPEVIFENLKQTDPLVRQVVGKALMSGQTTDEVAIIKSSKIPYAVFQGAGDKLINPSYFNFIGKDFIWKERIQTIENAGHCPQIENPVAFNNLLLDFMVFTEGNS